MNAATKARKIKTAANYSNAAKKQRKEALLK